MFDPRRNPWLWLLPVLALVALLTLSVAGTGHLDTAFLLAAFATVLLLLEIVGAVPLEQLCVVHEAHTASARSRAPPA